MSKVYHIKKVTLTDEFLTFTDYENRTIRAERRKIPIFRSLSQSQLRMVIFFQSSQIFEIECFKMTLKVSDIIDIMVHEDTDLRSETRVNDRLHKRHLELVR